MQIGGFGNKIGNLGAKGAGNANSGPITTFSATNDSSGDLYASLYEPGAEDYMMDGAGLDVYA